MSNQTNSTSNAPIDRIRLGRISAAIWKQTADDGRSFYNFSLERTYKDNDGNFQSSSSFALSDALVVAKVANQADTRIRRLLDVDYASTRANESLDEEA